MSFAETLLAVIQITAPLTTYVVFLSPIPSILKFVTKGYSDADPFEPYMFGAICSGLWLRYGFLKHESTVIQVNLIGGLLNVIYSILFIAYARRKTPLMTKSIISIGLLAALFYHISTLSEDAAIDRLGGISSMIQMIAVASPLAGLPEVIRSQSTENLPFPLMATGFLCGIQWLMFGILIGDLYMTIPNIIGCVLGALQLSLFVIYPAKKQSQD